MFVLIFIHFKDDSDKQRISRGHFRELEEPLQYSGDCQSQSEQSEVQGFLPRRKTSFGNSKAILEADWRAKNSKGQ